MQYADFCLPEEKNSVLSPRSTPRYSRLRMFYFYAIGSMLGYAVQQTLLVHHARKMDGLSLAFYRNISFVVILLGTVLLGMNHTHMPHLDSRFGIGISFIVIKSIPLAYLTYVLAYLSRNADPFVSGYFWEISIGIACLFLLVLRSLIFGKHIQKIDVRTFFIIAACSFPTLIGTGFMSLASRDGPIGIINAIGSGLLVVSALLARFLYNEKLGKGQWASMLLILAGIVALKFV